jgi:integrase
MTMSWRTGKIGARDRIGHQRFANPEGNPYVGTSLNHCIGTYVRQKVEGKRRPIFQADFVLHSLRHTMLTRLGESGVDAFTITRIAGHGSIVVSQRYIQPTPEAVECAFERLHCLAKDPKLSRKDSYPLQYPLHCRSRCR